MARKSSSDDGDERNLDQIGNVGKRKEPKRAENRTYVFDIQLTEYTNENYAEYNWRQLVQKEESNEGDSDIEIIEIREGSQNKNRKKKIVKPADPEDDYDLEDDFIDDSEVNDEDVPEEISTACGGFYINHGNLTFRNKDGRNVPNLIQTSHPPEDDGMKEKTTSICVGVSPCAAGKRSNGLAR